MTSTQLQMKLNKAVCDGDLVKIQRLRSAGAPWDETTCATAAMFGHFVILKWLHRNGCPMGASTFDRAAESGHTDIAVWVTATGYSKTPPPPPPTTTLKSLNQELHQTKPPQVLCFVVVPGNKDLFFVRTDAHSTVSTAFTEKYAEAAAAGFNNVLSRVHAGGRHLVY